MKITVDMVMACGPCYSRKKLKALAAGREWMSGAEVAALSIPVKDRAWLFSRMLGPRDTTREVARRITREALVGKKIPDAYLAWLDSGAEELRDYASGLAEDAADSDIGCTAWGAAWHAAGDVLQTAAWGAAWDAAVELARKTAQNGDYAPFDIWQVAMEKYVLWMAEWLDSHGEEYDEDNH